jgi:hypothetical protein
MKISVAGWANGAKQSLDAWMECNYMGIGRCLVSLRADLQAMQVC